MGTTLGRWSNVSFTDEIIPLLLIRGDFCHVIVTQTLK